VSELTTREHQGILIIEIVDVRLTQEIDIQEMGSDLINYLNETKLDKVLLNFKNVKRMASSMIGKLNMLRKKAIAEKIDLRLCCLSNDIKEVFELTKLDTIFDIYASEEEAFAGFERYKKKWYV